jgi:F-type H+-transporting ATPase subunit b
MLELTWTRLAAAAGALAAAEPSPLEFTWKSFALAAANFLILVAILYRLLHKPLLDMLQKRRQAVEDAHRAAENQAEEARKTRQEYEGRLAGIEEERDKMLAEARKAAEEARSELVRKARAEAEREIANMRRDWDRQRRDALRGLRDDVVALSLDLARRTLAQLVDEDVETRLRAALRARLKELANTADRRTLESLFPAGGTVRVVSAAPLDDEERGLIGDLIQALTEEKAELSFETDEDLIAGVRVEFSSQAIDSTLADVLEAVRERIDELAPETDEEEAAS